MARFWDASALIPLLVRESTTSLLFTLLRNDEHVIVWWGTRVECVSAFARRVRQGGFEPEGELESQLALESLGSSWSEVQPTNHVRAMAEHLLVVHPLRAADALQLAAAVAWRDGEPNGQVFVCLDGRLTEAARKEGFTIQPTDISLEQNA